MITERDMKQIMRVLRDLPWMLGPPYTLKEQNAVRMAKLIERRIKRRERILTNKKLNNNGDKKC